MVVKGEPGALAGLDKALVGACCDVDWEATERLGHVYAEFYAGCLLALKVDPLWK